jgi:hypothetical protein
MHSAIRARKAMINNKGRPKRHKERATRNILQVIQDAGMQPQQALALHKALLMMMTVKNHPARRVPLMKVTPMMKAMSRKWEKEIYSL